MVEWEVAVPVVQWIVSSDLTLVASVSHGILVLIVQNILLMFYHNYNVACFHIIFDSIFHASLIS